MDSKLKRFGSLWLVLALLAIVILVSWVGGSRNKQEPITEEVLEDAVEAPVYPAINYMYNGLAVENEYDILYTNVNTEYPGIYLYNKQGQATAIILDETGENLTLVGEELYYTRDDVLYKTDLTARSPRQLLPKVTALTAYGEEIYYTAGDGVLYQLDTHSDTSTVLWEGKTLWPQATQQEIRNISLGDRLYFTLHSTIDGVERIDVLCYTGDGAVKTIAENMDTSLEWLVFDTSRLYFVTEAGLSRMKLDGSKEELLIPATQEDGAICEQFSVYDGTWYYQKKTTDGGLFFCSKTATTDEKILLDLNEGDLAQILSLNHTEDFIFLIMPNTIRSEAEHVLWIYNRDKEAAQFITYIFPSV